MCSPTAPKPLNLPKKVKAVSPNGIRLVEEAEAALEQGLKSIVGPGLRKALEFLIKDFLKYSQPGKKAEIEKTALGNCVKEWSSDHNLRKAAERAVWLGNDETHYLRVWTDHDVSDLQKLIHLTINWIDSELTLAEYEKKMPSKK